MVLKGRSVMQNPAMIAEFKARGVYKKGAENPRAILNEEQASKIKSLLSAPHSVPEIARSFGVSKGAVYAIKIGRTWREVRALK